MEKSSRGADVYIFNKIKDRMQGKALWLRNNVSTILCNCLENFGFIGLAFWGIYDAKTIVTIAVSTSIIELIVALLDTPFLYVARRIGGQAGYDKKEKSWQMNRTLLEEMKRTS